MFSHSAQDSTIPTHKVKDNRSIFLYNSVTGGTLTRLMTDSNLNFWGLIAVPVGVCICFGIALLVWLRDEFRARSEEKRKSRP
jgi:hypothetical protein